MSFFPDRSLNASYMYSHVNATSTFIMANTFSQVFCVIGILFFFRCALLIRNVLKNLNKNAKTKKLILSAVAGNIFFSVALSFWSLSVTTTWSMDPILCTYWGGAGGMLTCFRNFFSYIVLFMRAEAVGVVRNSGSRMQRTFKYMLAGVKIGTISVPLIAFMSFFLFKGTLYYSEEICIQIVSPAIIMVACALDTFLSIGYLLLFLLPVISHMKTMHNLQKKEAYQEGATMDDKIKKTAIKNLQISVVAMTSTFLYMIGVTLVATYLDISEDDRMVPYLQWLTFQYVFGPVDCAVNTACSMLITHKLWAEKKKGRTTTVLPFDA